jgi:putative transposase
VVVDEDRRQDLEYRQMLLREACHKYLDAGHGSCVLGDRECAEVVRESLMFHHESRYRLIAWTIMPNHVHVIIETSGSHSLGEIQKTFKRHTTRELKKIICEWPNCAAVSTRVDWAKAKDLLLPRRRVWQREAWDRFIRDGEHMSATVEYIMANPVKAGLVEDSVDWPWCGVLVGDGEEK